MSTYGFVFMAIIRSRLYHSYGVKVEQFFLPFSREISREQAIDSDRPPDPANGVVKFKVMLQLYGAHFPNRSALRIGRGTSHEYKGF